MAGQRQAAHLWMGVEPGRQWHAAMAALLRKILVPGGTLGRVHRSTWTINSFYRKLEGRALRAETLSTGTAAEAPPGLPRSHASACADELRWMAAQAAAIFGTPGLSRRGRAGCCEGHLTGGQ